LRRHTASSFIIGFRGWAPQFALLFPSADSAAVFAVEALVHTSRRGSAITLHLERDLPSTADLLRPSAEKAKPDERNL
jgi:hypothetical protein